MQDFKFVYDEDTGSWKEKKEPYITSQLLPIEIGSL